MDADADPLLKVSAKIQGKSKTQCCLFCNQLVTKLPRHLRRKHMGEQAVAAAECFSPKSKKRADALKELRLKGNLKYNSEVIKKGSGDLIVSKRPYTDSAIDTWLSCPNCGAYMQRNDIFRHIRYCETHISHKSTMQTSAPKPINKNATAALCSRVLSRMNLDDTSEAVKADSLICMFGSFLCEKYSADYERTHNRYISQRIRQLGRLLLVLREQNESISCLMDIFTPKHFDALVQATKNMAIIENGNFKVASVGLGIGHSISACIELLNGHFIRLENLNASRQLQYFAQLFKSEWTTKVSSKSLKTLERNKYNKEMLLPIADDIQKLTKHIIAQEEKYIHVPVEDANYSTYLQLANLILCRLILFNRKRIGDVDKFRIEQFENRDKTINPDIVRSLSMVERQLMSSFIHVEVRGKRGKRLPLMIPNSTEQSILRLLKMRCKVGVPSKNPYIFGKKSMDGYIRGDEAINKVIRLCELQYPDRITSTKCRKHIATMSQVMNLRPHEMEGLAKFMGHDYSIHKSFYRLPDSSLHLAKFSKLLLAVESGDVANFKCMNLDNLDINDVSYQYQEQENGRENNHRSKKTLVGKGRGRPWSQEEVDAVKKHLSLYLTGIKPGLPGKIECQEVIAKEPCLQTRTWYLLKYFVKNHQKINVNITN